MGLSIYNLLKAALLVANAAAVLHPQRFLRKCAPTRPRGASRATVPPSPVLPRPPPSADGMETPDGTVGVKSQLATGFAAMRNMRVPLLICNLIVVVIELLFG